MGLYITKVLISAVIIVAVTESAKFSNLWASLIASLPLVSVIAIVWLYIDTNDLAKVADLSWGILYIVIPSLAFFILLPTLLKYGVHFWIALPSSCLATGLLYLVYLKILDRIGISI